jgi:hypothetical protein
MALAETKVRLPWVGEFLAFSQTKAITDVYYRPAAKCHIVLGGCDNHLIVMRGCGRVSKSPCVQKLMSSQHNDRTHG